MPPLATPEPQSLAALVQRAAESLACAVSAAEVLDALNAARVAFDAARSAARLAKFQVACDDVRKAAHRVQADALAIETLALRKLADEYDRAQIAGLVRRHGQRRLSQPETVGFQDIGLCSKDVHVGRRLQAAEADEPGFVRRVLDARLDAGLSPTKSALRAAVAEKIATLTNGTMAPSAEVFNLRGVIRHQRLKTQAVVLARIIDDIGQLGPAPPEKTESGVFAAVGRQQLKRAIAALRTYLPIAGGGQ